MRAALPILASTCLATSLLSGQELPPPIPGEEPSRPSTPGTKDPDTPATKTPPAAPQTGPVAKEPFGPRIPKAQPLVKIPLGTKEVKPVVPTVDRLLESSESAKVEADSMWLIIEHAKRRGMTTIDVGSDGVCQLIERKFGETGRGDPVIVRAGKSVPKSISSAMMDLARQKGVLFSIGRDRLLLGAGADRLQIGVAANRGRSVHTSPSAAFDEYPKEVRAAATALLEAARDLPMANDVQAVISAEFVDPRQARRLTTLGGSRLISVKDPGREATLLPPAVAASRMPGRKIVVRDALEWEKIRAYMTAGGLNPAADGQCLISVGSQVYRLSVEVVGGE